MHVHACVLACVRCACFVMFSEFLRSFNRRRRLRGKRFSIAKTRARALRTQATALYGFGRTYNAAGAVARRVASSRVASSRVASCRVASRRVASRVSRRVASSRRYISRHISGIKYRRPGYVPRPEHTTLSGLLPRLPLFHRRVRKRAPRNNCTNAPSVSYFI